MTNPSTVHHEPPIPDWAQGYTLARLQAYSDVFQAQHKALVFGNYGLVKERDIAEALTLNVLAWKGPATAPTAVAIVHRLKNAGGFTDFARRVFAIPGGSVRVVAFAARDVESGCALLAALAEKAPHALWVEIFEEDRIASECLARLFPALPYRATRITAGSEVKGVYTNAPLGPELFLHEAEWASVLEIAPDFAPADERAAMLAEADAYAEWEQHYSSYNKRRSWTAFALRGYDADDPRFIVKPAEMAKGWKERNPQRLEAKPAWTRAAERFPATMACVARILAGREADRVRLMRLAPHGELSRHADITDREAGLADGLLARLHLPLRTSDKVIFHGWDKRGRHVTTAFREGALCYLDQRGPHRVENRDSKLQRIHLVVDAKSDAALRELIVRGMDAQ